MGDNRAIEPAVNQLVQRLIWNDARFEPDLRAEEIVLDIEVGGFRYLTVRCSPSPLPCTEVDKEIAPPPELSPREFEIARMVAKGYNNKTIASVLDISSWTVSSHLRRAYTKLGVTSRAAMVARLLEHRPNASVAEQVSRDPDVEVAQLPRNPVSSSRKPTFNVT